MKDQPRLDDLLDRLVATLEDLARWQRLIGLQTARDVLTSALDSDQLKLAYSLCDGDHTLREIASTAGVSLGTVSNWTRRWRDLGIVYETSAGRMQHLISHEALA